jgi:hypothetical protein
LIALPGRRGWVGQGVAPTTSPSNAGSASGAYKERRSAALADWQLVAREIAALKARAPSYGDQCVLA